MTKDIILKLLKDELRIHPLRVKNIYLFGSRCYGNFSDNSDYDIIVISNNSVENIEHNIGDYNIHIQTEDYFKSKLDWNDIKSIECLLWENKIMETVKFDLNIDKNKIRHSILHTSSRSWYKSKKKIENGEHYIGQKSLYHCLRILMFGIQIAEKGNIYKWDECNKYWEDITKNKSWVYLENKYTQIYDNLKYDFINKIK